MVCDNSKFESDGLFQFADWENIDYLITDRDVPREKIERFNNLLKVIIAS